MCFMKTWFFVEIKFLKNYLLKLRKFRRPRQPAPTSNGREESRERRWQLSFGKLDEKSKKTLKFWKEKKLTSSKFSGQHMCALPEIARIFVGGDSERAPAHRHQREGIPSQLGHTRGHLPNARKNFFIHICSQAFKSYRLLSIPLPPFVIIFYWLFLWFILDFSQRHFISSEIRPFLPLLSSSSFPIYKLLRS